ncbi:MAG: hypothetical protein CMP20_09160 [Rickettsiales bacterium]|nr:hypothetical protein [Rickettsiales bacterium]
MALPLARLLTGFYDKDKALDAFEALTDEDVYRIVPSGEFSPFAILDFLATSIASNETQNAAATLLASVRDLALLPRGQELLKLTFPLAAKAVIDAFFAPADESDDLVFEAISQVVRPLQQALATTVPASMPVKNTRVLRLSRPKLNDPIFKLAALSPVRTTEAADFIIRGLYSDDDARLNNDELFQSLTRQTLSGVSMTFEAQFKRHLAWRAKGADFEDALERLESDSSTVFETPKGIPRGWPGWSRLGGVMLPFQVYLERVYKMRFANLDTLLERVDLQGYAPTAKKVFYELRALWVLRHLAFLQQDHTYATLKPVLDLVEADLKSADLKPPSLGNRQTVDDIVPPGVERILTSRIAVRDMQNRYFSDFAGLDPDAPEDRLETIAKIPYLAMARILRSSPDQTFEDPVFTQVVARGISSHTRQLIASRLDTVADPAATTNDAVSNSVSVFPTVRPYLYNGRTQSGLKSLERYVFSFSSTSITSKLKSSLTRKGFDPESLWFNEPLAMMLTNVRPFGPFQTSGAFSSVRPLQGENLNMGFGISVLGDLVSSQTYFVDSVKHPVRLQGPEQVSDADAVFPVGMQDAAQKLTELQHRLAIASPLDNIESTVARLQSVCGNRVELVSEQPINAANLVTLDAENYPTMDFLHSAYTNYFAPFGRCWAWLRHSMVRRGIELIQNDRLFELVQAIDASNSWTWQMANGTAKSLRQVYQATNRLHATTGTVRFSVDTIDELPEELSSGVHPASLLMAFISGDLEDETLTRATEIYNETTAPLMSFIVNYRMSDVAIADLGLSNFTNSIVFNTLKDLTEAMIQRLDSDIARLAERTPLGKFVVAAARGVGQKVEITDDAKTDIAELEQRRQDAQDVLLDLINESDNSESYQQRLRQQRQVLFDASQQLATIRSESKRRVVALWPGGPEALQAIDEKANERYPEVGREYTIPVYTLFPETGTVSAVSDSFIETPTGLMVQRVDAIFVGTKAQKHPDRFADEVETFVLTLAEQQSGVQANSLKETLKEACRSVFSLGALLAGSDTVEPVVDAARKMLTDGGPSETNIENIPLARLYVDEPFDYGLETVENLCNRLLTDLRKSLERRLELRTTGKDGLTKMEKIRKGQLSAITLKRPKKINPIVYNWVNSNALTPTGSFKPIVVINESLPEPIGQSISIIRPNIKQPISLEYAECLAFLYDRLQNGTKRNTLLQIYSVATGAAVAISALGKEVKQLVLACQTLDPVVVEALCILQPNINQFPTLSTINEWILNNQPIIDRLDLWLKSEGYWRVADLTAFETENSDKGQFIKCNVLAIIDTIELVRAVRILKNPTFDAPGVQALEQALPYPIGELSAQTWLETVQRNELLQMIETVTEQDKKLENYVFDGKISIVRNQKQLFAPPATGSLSTAMDTPSLIYKTAVIGGRPVTTRGVSTNTGRYAMWATQVETMLALCAIHPNNRATVEILLWPWAYDMFQSSVSPNKWRHKAGLSKKLIIGQGWIPQYYIRESTAVGSTVSMMLLKELIAVKESLGPNRWSSTLDPATVVDRMMGNINQSVTIPFERFAGTIYSAPDNTKVATHYVRVYTMAVEILTGMPDYGVIFDNMAVAEALIQVRQSGQFTSTFYDTVVGERRLWNGLPENRKTLPKFRKVKRPIQRYALDYISSNRQANEEVLYRLTQSAFTALHTNSIIDECKLISERPMTSIVQSKPVFRLFIHQPAVIVAGMLRATEPLVVRFANDVYGVWIEPNQDGTFSSVLGKRIEEMFDYVNNTTDTPASSNSSKYGIFTVNKHSLQNRPDQSWLEPADALLNSQQAYQPEWLEYASRFVAIDGNKTTIDFSRYSTENSIVETFVVLSKDQLVNFWKIVNMENVAENQHPLIFVPQDKKLSSQFGNASFVKALYEMVQQGPRQIVDGEADPEAGSSFVDDDQTTSNMLFAPVEQVNGTSQLLLSTQDEPVQVTHRQKRRSQSPTGDEPPSQRFAVLDQTYRFAVAVQPTDDLLSLDMSAGSQAVDINNSSGGSGSGILPPTSLTLLDPDDLEQAPFSVDDWDSLLDFDTLPSMFDE